MIGAELRPDAARDQEPGLAPQRAGHRRYGGGRGAALKIALGPAWKKTAIVAASEFGRTVAVNGTGGTDHGTAGIALLFGGVVAGGSVHAEWMGLKPAALKDGRDLPAKTDMRAIFKAALSEHFGITRQVLDDQVFPDSGSILVAKGLIRA
jgi:uncharacterized protein (DUF1501 family)